MSKTAYKFQVQGYNYKFGPYGVVIPYLIPKYIGEDPLKSLIVPLYPGEVTLDACQATDTIYAVGDIVRMDIHEENPLIYSLHNTSRTTAREHEVNLMPALCPVCYEPLINSLTIYQPGYCWNRNCRAQLVRNTSTLLTTLGIRSELPIQCHATLYSAIGRSKFIPISTILEADASMFIDPDDPDTERYAEYIVQVIERCKHRADLVAILKSLDIPMLTDATRTTLAKGLLTEGVDLNMILGMLDAVDSQTCYAFFSYADNQQLLRDLLRIL